MEKGTPLGFSSPSFTIIATPSISHRNDLHLEGAGQQEVGKGVSLAANDYSLQAQSCLKSIHGGPPWPSLWCVYPLHSPVTLRSTVSPISQRMSYKLATRDMVILWEIMELNRGLLRHQAHPMNIGPHLPSIKKGQSLLPPTVLGNVTVGAHPPTISTSHRPNAEQSLFGQHWACASMHL